MYWNLWLTNLDINCSLLRTLLAQRRQHDTDTWPQTSVFWCEITVQQDSTSTGSRLHWDKRLWLRTLLRNLLLNYHLLPTDERTRDTEQRIHEPWACLWIPCSFRLELVVGRIHLQRTRIAVAFFAGIFLLFLGLKIVKNSSRQMRQL